MTALSGMVMLAVKIAHGIWASSIDIFGPMDAISGYCSVMMG